LPGVFRFGTGAIGDFGGCSCCFTCLVLELLALVDLP
jgi:hypothetical protein